MAPLSPRFDVRGFVCAPVEPSTPALSFSIAPGGCLALLGDRAVDLSRVLDTLAGHLPCVAGEVLLDGRDVAALPAGHRGMGLFSARDPLFAHLTVRRNLAFPLEARGMARPAIVARVDAVLALLGLDGCASRRPRALDPQDEWRARLGRLLVFAPSVLLLDDPFAGLARGDRLAMRRLLARVARAQGLTLLLATGDREDVLLLGDAIGVLSGRALLQVGNAAELFDRPACDRVATGFGDANALTGRVAWVEDDLASVHLASGARVEAMAGPGLADDMLCTLCVRPDRIATLFPTGRAAADDDGEDTLPAVLAGLHHMGDHIRLRFRLEDGQEVLVRRPPAQSLTGLVPGRTARLAWQPAHAVAFPFRGEMG
ncbi:ABC transporter ATP-binding protein [Gluconacetobacter sp. 1b LMG 1731]|uniref:ABC transporter ATP-binding protein n=1 Tax=Gluconacetobacter dulcium TaxID=2729096 RepID=A0A7W4INV8_9PROT|nr:ABC transporter ATP-binding protein [Gluconacetobacter dulcium]MBB2166321.1 ABC transporter ATP-binding protein [Gluconacetobacter dulcium]MBB2195419.1 ABC transporter ATP-binding protein [Gluconacetobacter dulcium]